MSEKLNQLRDQALASCIAEFDEKIAKSVETFTEADVTDEDIQCVKDKYRNAYKNFFTTAFDIAFQKELLAKLKENQKEEKNNSVEIIEDEDLNLSVTDEDLQKLDNANTLVTIYRKVKPPKCTLLLEKSLKLQIDSVSKIKTNVNGVESINPEEAEVTHDNLSLELNQEYSKLRGDIKEELDKLRRFESAAQILVGNQQIRQNNVVQEANDAKDNSIQA